MRISQILALGILLALIGLSLPMRELDSPVSSTVYVDPAVRNQSASHIELIVTASSSEEAAILVEEAGGVVLDDLWLINAVAAVIPSDSVDSLSSLPGVRSLVANAAVETSGVGDDEWDGYVSRRFTRRPGKALNGIIVERTYLKTGGMAIVDRSGLLSIFSEDGEVLKEVQIGSGLVQNGLASDMHGHIYTVDERGNIRAFDALGNSLWTYSLKGSEKFTTGPTVQNGLLFVNRDLRWFDAYATNGGERVWAVRIDEKKLGAFTGPPMAGSDGSVYVGYTGEGSDPQGRVISYTADGALRWMHATEGEGQIEDVRFDAASNRLYLTMESGLVRILDANGQIVHDRPNSEIIVPLSSAMFLAQSSATEIVAFNGDGSERYRISPASSVVDSPIPSQDGTRFYFVDDAGRLHAMDSQNGTLLWQSGASENISAAPMVLKDGTIAALTAGGDLLLFDPAGTIIHEVANVSDLGGVQVEGERYSLFIMRGESNVQAVTRLPKEWKGKADVGNLGDKKVWDLVNPVAVDIGADLLHDGIAGQSIDGAGVTVAVLDSGVYFDKEVKKDLGSQVEHLFVGQADFVDDRCEIVGSNKKQSTIGFQFDTHCFTDSESSKDRYGHGTHVAGSIWNQFSDYGTGTFLGVAPAARILSVRVLDENGAGSYADAIAGIQYIIEHKEHFGIRVLNMSMSANATTPYFVDPLNRAVMAAWAEGLVVVAAAGNSGPTAQSITVPGNNPYVITVGAVDSQRTPGYWPGDTLPGWSATGPTLDGFIKPDILAPGAQIVSFMHNDPMGQNTASLVSSHPDYSESMSLFRMNGTSMATGLTSGVVALMLEANPSLTPDQVKYRLLHSARPALTEEAAPLYNLLQQGMGRIWAPDAVLGDFPADGIANQGMDIQQDLAYGFETDEERAQHYQGPVQRSLSDDGQSYLYYLSDGQGAHYGLGSADVDTLEWKSLADLVEERPTWENGSLGIDQGLNWAGGVSLGAGVPTWAGGMSLWSGGMSLWSGGVPTWAGGMNWNGTSELWSGGMSLWSGGLPTWAGGMGLWSGGMSLWSGGLGLWSTGMSLWSSQSSWSSSVGTAPDWVDDEWVHQPSTEESAQPAAEVSTAPSSDAAESNSSIVHVNDIDNVSYWVGSKKWRGAFSIEVVDGAGAAVSDAHVVGTITEASQGRGETFSCVTDESGRCLLESHQFSAKKVDELTLRIDDIHHSTLQYDASLNQDADGDSDGTVLRANLPSVTANHESTMSQSEPTRFDFTHQLHLPVVQNH